MRLLLFFFFWFFGFLFNIIHICGKSGWHWWVCIQQNNTIIYLSRHHFYDSNNWIEICIICKCENIIIYYEDEPCVTLNTMLTDVKLTKFSKMKLNEWDSICGVGCCCCYYCCLLWERMSGRMPLLKCAECSMYMWPKLQIRYKYTNTLNISMDLQMSFSSICYIVILKFTYYSWRIAFWNLLRQASLKWFKQFNRSERKRV